MNGISTDAWVGLIGVAVGGALGFLGSLIVMRFEDEREARRIADQRRYEWVKERLDKVEEYISPLYRTSYELTRAARPVLHWTLAWWLAPGPERVQMSGTVQHFVDALKEALEPALATGQRRPEIVFGFLEREILDRVYELNLSFGSLRVMCSSLLVERAEVTRQARESDDLRAVKEWKEKWDEDIDKEYAIFEKTYGELVDAMRRILTRESGYRAPSLLKRLRRALFSKEGWKYWLALAVVIILALVGWAIARGVIRLPPGA